MAPTRASGGLGDSTTNGSSSSANGHGALGGGASSSNSSHDGLSFASPAPVPSGGLASRRRNLNKKGLALAPGAAKPGTQFLAPPLQPLQRPAVSSLSSSPAQAQASPSPGGSSSSASSSLSAADLEAMQALGHAAGGLGLKLGATQQQYQQYAHTAGSTNSAASFSLVSSPGPTSASLSLSAGSSTPAGGAGVPYSAGHTPRTASSNASSTATTTTTYNNNTEQQDYYAQLASGQLFPTSAGGGVGSVSLTRRPSTASSRSLTISHGSHGGGGGGGGGGGYSGERGGSGSGASSVAGGRGGGGVSGAAAGSLADALHNLQVGIELKLDLRQEDLAHVNELGSGNGGTVSKVVHLPTKLVMAKKVIHIATSPSTRKQIVRELQIMHDCASPHIVSFYGAYVHETHICLCMEYMDLGSLEAIYKRNGPVPEPILAQCARAVVGGLTYLYEAHKIMHRDVKPSNILLARSGAFKICDFGVSGELINSVADTFVGTSTYMSPERISGDPYSVKSDVWSLGITLVELALGRFPFVQDDSTTDDDDVLTSAAAKAQAPSTIETDDETDTASSSSGSSDNAPEDVVVDYDDLYDSYYDDQAAATGEHATTLNPSKPARRDESVAEAERRRLERQAREGQGSSSSADSAAASASFVAAPPRKASLANAAAPPQRTSSLHTAAASASPPQRTSSLRSTKHSLGSLSTQDTLTADPRRNNPAAAAAAAAAVSSPPQQTSRAPSDKLRPNRKKSKRAGAQQGVGGAGQMSILELLQYIVNEPAPRLPPARKRRRRRRRRNGAGYTYETVWVDDWSAACREFIDACLRKEKNSWSAPASTQEEVDQPRRPTPKELLEFDWLKAADEAPEDLVLRFARSLR